MIISLIFLLLITLIATTAAQTSTFQLQMAGNDQSRVDAQQRTMAMMDAIMDDSDNAPIIGDIGYKICDTSSVDVSCDEKLIDLASSVTTIPSGSSADYFVIRRGPLETDPPTMSEARASSASAYKVARYEVTANFDGSGSRLGTSSMGQGMLVKIPALNN
jgi:hypothetical protein